jgi:RNA polymerase sigma-70 factor (ECF subfamily)
LSEISPDPSALINARVAFGAPGSSHVGTTGCQVTPVKSTMSTTNIIENIPARGDGQAFGRLFRDYAPLVKSYMMRQGADANTAEELAQETLLSVWRKSSLYASDKGSLKTWIFTIARNLRIDRLRKELRWLPLPEGYDQQASQDATPDDAWAQEERRVRVQRALAELPPDQNAVVNLSFVDGLSHAEIAARLGLPLGTVKSRLRLSYLRVRGMVEDLN